ncbi:uncharacterized protein LOC125959325 [Anopheles darlingi]|uniref:uncharacterized protein LOC125959325 n=1 Tax=Anopheles darlingi TaxID=43151 RepID=UPI0021005DAF|nr:uncharacterized protein LOC125959325 [Anopheles darlingi]
MDKQLSSRLEAALNEGHNQEHRQLRLDDGPGHLMWFLQISDIHISKYLDPTRVPHLVEFCNRTVDIIRPRPGILAFWPRVGTSQFKLKFKFRTPLDVTQSVTRANTFHVTRNTSHETSHFLL